MLWLSLYLPHLALEVFARGERRAAPLAIYIQQGNRQLVHVRNRAAAQRGIRPGMPINAALALCAELNIRARDEAAEAAALHGLAVWAGQFTSLLSVQSPQGLLLEIEGSLLLFGGLEALREHIAQGVAELGYRARLAVASTPLGAWLLARAGYTQSVTDLPTLTRVLHPLPLSVLECPVQDLAALRGLGLRHVGDCVRLPRAGLAKRFGEDFLDYLDKAFGLRPDPRPRFNAPEQFSAQLPLPAEVTHSEALLFAARRLIVELQGFLLARGAGVQTLVLDLLHADHACSTLSVGLVRPTRDAEHLTSLLRETLERHQLIAPVEGLVMHAEHAIELHGSHRDLFTSRHPEHRDWQQLVEQLRARLGEDRISGVCTCSDHRPELAWRYCPPGENVRLSVGRLRPVWLLPHPQLLVSVDAQPWMDGELNLTRGPERIESGWWDDNDIGRDYFIAENARHERFWIYREIGASIQWFLHGVFA